MFDTGRVHHHPGVVPHHHAPHLHFAGDAVDLHIRYPCRPSRAVTRPLAVNVARVSEALTEEDVAARTEPAVRVFLRPGAQAPAGLLRRRLHQFDGARVVQMAQPELHRIDTRRRRQLVDVRLVRERIRQRRHAAQPRRPHDRRHVVDLHAQVLVRIRRARGAVAHLVGMRDRLDGAREQQRERRRAVRGVRSLEVVGGDATVGPQPAVDLHQLRRALRLPRMLLLARQLHAHRRADCAGQQRCIGGHVVGAVAAIAAGGFHAHHVDLQFVQRHELCEIGTQHVRTLRAGPDAQCDAVGSRIDPRRHRARRPDRRMHLIRPHIGAAHRLRGLAHRAVDIAFVDQHALRRRVVAQRLRHVRQVGHAGPRLPRHAQLAHGLLGMFLALGDHADEVAQHHHGAQSGDVRDGRFVDRRQRVADEVAVVRTCVRRSHDAPMQHAGHAHVVDENEFARELGRYVDARLRRTDQPVIGSWFGGGERIELQHGALPGDQRADGDAAIRRVADRHHAVIDAQPSRRHAEFNRSPRQQPVPRLRRRRAQGHRMHLNRRARDGAALIGRARRIAQHHVHRVERHVEFFGGDLRECGADAGAEIDMAVQRGHAAVVPHGKQDFVALGRVARHGDRLSAYRRGRWRRRSCDDEHAIGRKKVAALARQVGSARGHPQITRLRLVDRPAEKPPAAPRGRSPHACRSGKDSPKARRGCVLRRPADRAPATPPPASPCR